MKKFITPEIEHMIRLEVESKLRNLLPQIVRPLVRKILHEKEALDFEDVNFYDD
jgi:hypothetical protein